MKQKMKGMSLPMEVMVIIAVVVLVMVVLVAFFIEGSGKEIDKIDKNAAFGEGCARLGTYYKCAYSDDKTKEAALKEIILKDQGSLLDVCKSLGFSDADACWRACSCPG
ncbi:MAG: hypothetical protein HZB65_04195 [Candidatus Aenigmarchaeota archaeon]|nr:hypothetical protein [Candidatus Aenigmarchaeota archaeon]